MCLIHALHVIELTTKHTLILSSYQKVLRNAIKCYPRPKKIYVQPATKIFLLPMDKRITFCWCPRYFRYGQYYRKPLEQLGPKYWILAILIKDFWLFMLKNNHYNFSSLPIQNTVTLYYSFLSLSNLYNFTHFFGLKSS